MAGLPCFTAKSDQHVSADVRMLGKPRQGSVQLFVIGATILHSAPALVRDRKNTVHVWEISQPVITKTLGHCSACRRRTIHRAHETNVVAGPYPAVGSFVPHKKTRLIGLRVSRAFGTERVVSLKFLDRDVVCMDPVPGFNILAGEPNYLAIFANRLSLTDQRQCQLMTLLDRFQGGDGMTVDANWRTLGQTMSGDGDVIFRPQHDDGAANGRCWHRILLNLSIIPRGFPRRNTIDAGCASIPPGLPGMARG